jgi:hypothetical protein
MAKQLCAAQLLRSGDQTPAAAVLCQGCQHDKEAQLGERAS